MSTAFFYLIIRGRKQVHMEEAVAITIRVGKVLSCLHRNALLFAYLAGGKRYLQNVHI